MNNFTFYTNPTLTLVCVPAGLAGLYSLASLARLAGVHPDMLRYYCLRGLLGDGHVEEEGGVSFDLDALETVRRIEHFRRHLGIGRRALPLVCELWSEGERLEIELGFLRAT
jgi:DNA-binding transcriptional MerR regulator